MKFNGDEKYYWAIKLLSMNLDNGYFPWLNIWYWSIILGSTSEPQMKTVRKEMT